MPGTQSTPDPIVLNLDIIDEAYTVAPEDRDRLPVHYKAMDEFRRAIHRVHGKVKPFLKKLEERGAAQNCNQRLSHMAAYPRHHDVITLYGGRGAGKTTFLLSALGDIEKEGGRYVEEGTAQGLYPLGLLDPTLMGNKEHILISVLERIATAVHTHQNKVGRAGCSPDTYSPAKGCRYEQWYDSLNNLARGLKQIDEGDDEDKPRKATWGDEAYVFNQLLKDARSGGELERSFHCLIKDALEILGTDAFVIAFDDIDTKFKIGWHVLEVLRKFFTTPQLIVILSGDMELFTTLVRKEQNKMFGKEKDPLDDVSGKPWCEQAESLIEQYLLKILPAGNRIEIPPFDSIYRAARQEQRKLLIRHNHELQEFDAIIKDYCVKAHGVHRASDQEAIRRIITNSPIRTLVQFLGNVCFNEHDDKPSLANIYLTDLLGFSFSKEMLDNIGSPHVLAHIFRRLYKANQSDVIHLVPNTGSRELDRLLFVLSAYLSEAIRRDPRLAVEYMFRSVLPQRILQWQGESIKAAKPHETPEAEFLIQFLRLEYRSRTIDVARRAVGAIRPVRGSQGAPLRTGTLHVLTNAPQREIPSTMRETLGIPEEITHMHTLASLSKSITSWHQQAIGLISVNIDYGKETSTYLSIFPLIVAIGTLLKCNTEKEVAATIADYGLIRSLPSTQISSDAEEDSDGIDPDLERDGNNAEEIDKEFLKFMVLWKEQNSQLGPVATGTLSRAFVRFTDTIARQDNDLKKPLYAGQVVHRWLVSWLNAVLVEECLSAQKAVDVGRLNPVNSDKIFLDNLGRVEKSDSSFPPLFSFIFSCPLFSLFLETHNRSLERGQVFKKQIEHTSDCLKIERAQIDSLLTVTRVEDPHFYNMSTALDFIMLKEEVQSLERTYDVRNIREDIMQKQTVNYNLEEVMEMNIDEIRFLIEKTKNKVSATKTRLLVAAKRDVVDGDIEGAIAESSEPNRIAASTLAKISSVLYPGKGFSVDIDTADDKTTKAIYNPIKEYMQTYHRITDFE